MWNGLIMIIVAGALLGAGYAAGRIQGAEICTTGAQAHDDQIRKEALNSAEMRLQSTQKLVGQIDQMYRNAARYGNTLADKLSDVQLFLDKASRNFQERIRNVPNDPTCRVPPDIVRMLNDGVAAPGPARPDAPSSPPAVSPPG